MIHLYLKQEYNIQMKKECQMIYCSCLVGFYQERKDFLFSILNFFHFLCLSLIFTNRHHGLFIRRESRKNKIIDSAQNVGRSTIRNLRNMMNHQEHDKLCKIKKNTNKNIKISIKPKNFYFKLITSNLEFLSSHDFLEILVTLNRFRK